MADNEAQLAAIMSKAKSGDGGQKKGKKGRQSSHNKKRGHYAAYSIGNRWLRNKIRKVRRHIKKFPNDRQAAGALQRILAA